MRLSLAALTLVLLLGAVTSSLAQLPYCYSGARITVKGGDTLVTKSIDDIQEGSVVRFSIRPLVNAFAYLITDEENNIIRVTRSNFVPIDGLPVGTYRVWAFSFIGDMLAQPGQNAANATLASFCYELTSNFVLLDIAEGAPYKVQILHHNDGESSLINAGENFPEVGGAARFKQIVDELRFLAFDNGYPSILFSAGDNFLAGPEFTAGQNRTDNGPSYDAILIGSLGYDAVALGNHDFDFGPDVLEQFIKDTNFDGVIGGSSSTTVTVETLEFLNEYNVATRTAYEGLFFGGLSGIDYDAQNDTYYLISDDPDSPRFYTADITFTDDKITGLEITGMTNIYEASGEIIKNGQSDPESIRLDNNGNLIWTSEGNINAGFSPVVREMAQDGSYVRDFNVPAIFTTVDAENGIGPRQNGAFESLAISTNGREVITSFELPLQQDGPVPTLEPTDAPVRVQFFDKETGEPSRQFAYMLDPLAFTGTIFATNGVVEILPIDENTFLFMERSAFFDEAETGNVIRIFKASIEGATDVSDIDALAGADYVPMTKELVLLIDYDAFAFANPVDNIEGITFGPKLSNGNQSLILASDDNFSAFGPQSNQFLLYEIDIDVETEQTGDPLKLMGPPFLSANLAYSEEPGLQALEAARRIRTSTRVFRGDIPVGVIGLTTPDLPFISSPRRTEVMSDLVAAVEAEVAALKAQGVNKFILLSHLQGIDNDIELAGQLEDIDVIIAGGGDEFLTNNPEADAIPGLIDVEDQRGSYPMQVQDATGKTVYLVSAPGGYTYLGNLTLTFSSNGTVIDVDEVSGPVKVITDKPDEDMQAKVVDPVSAYVADLANNILATTEVEINAVRGDVRTKETNGGNLIADALLWQANLMAASFGISPADVAIQNGGGIRNSVVVPAEGEISELTTFNMLPFPNFVTIVNEIPAAQFKSILERAVSEVENVRGQFAQIAGFEMVYDPNGQAQQIDELGNVIGEGSRIVEVTLGTGRKLVENGEVIADAPGVRIATIDFLARGGDAYPYEGTNFTTLGITYQQALANYLTTALVPNDAGYEVTAAQYPSGGEGRIQTITTDGLQAPVDPISNFNVQLPSFDLGVAPNPVFDQLNVRYELEEEGQTALILSDLTGKKLASLYSGLQFAGQQNMTFDISSLNLAPGSYLISLRSGNQIQSMPIIKE